MKIQIKGTGLRPKEIITIIARMFEENNIKSIDNLSLYFNSSNKKVLITQMKKSETDHEGNFDEVCF